MAQFRANLFGVEGRTTRTSSYDGGGPFDVALHPCHGRHDGAHRAASQSHRMGRSLEGIDPAKALGAVASNKKTGSPLTHSKWWPRYLRRCCMLGTPWALLVLIGLTSQPSGCSGRASWISRLHLLRIDRRPCRYTALRGRHPSRLFLAKAFLVSCLVVDSLHSRSVSEGPVSGLLDNRSSW